MGQSLHLTSRNDLTLLLVTLVLGWGAQTQAAPILDLTNSAEAFVENSKGVALLEVPEEEVLEPSDPSEVGNPFLDPPQIWPDGFLCDLNEDGACDCLDIDVLTELLAGGATDSEYDLDGNGEVDFDDREFFITDLLGSTFGDSDLNGVFDPSDLAEVFTHGFYDDPAPGRPLSYCEGDWNGDGVFDSSDLVLAFEESVFTPEPSSGLLLAIGLVGLIRRGRRSER